MKSFSAIDPHPCPPKRISKRIFFIEEIIERIERIRMALRRAGLFDGEVGGEEAVRKPLRHRSDFIAFVANMSIHDLVDDRAPGR